MPRPSGPYLSNRLRVLSLNSPPQTALFYARLYHSLCPNENDHESLHILALCFMEVNETYSALHAVRDRAEGGCASCAMILARCCQKLGRYTEGQVVLQRALKRGTGSISLPTLDIHGSPADAYLTLATLSHKGKVTATAFENYKKALLEDPWSWESFTGLCALGYTPEPDTIFPDPPISTTLRLTSSSSRQQQPSQSQVRPPTLSPNPMPRSSASEMPGLLPARRQLSPLAGSGGDGSGGFFTPDVAGPHAKLGMKGPAAWETPSFIGDTTFPTIAAESIRPTSRRPLPNIIQSLLPTGSLIPASFRPSATSTPVNAPASGDWAPLPNAPAMKRPRANNLRKTTDQPHGLPIRSNGRDLKSIEPNGEADAPVRRSSRLKAPAVSSGKVSSKPARDRRGQRSQSATSSTASVDMTSPTSQDGQMQVQADDWLRDVVRRCAKAHRFLSVYACAEAIREVDTLPVEVQTSAWALELVARAYYEMASYTIARRIYERLLEIEPYRLESLEHYSTLLWHLSDAPALSALSQSLMSISRESTQAWISTGNLFSLQRDHDEAMRCFKRATQIDPGCSYAWTLCGYEAIEMEEYDRAIAFYRTAIRTDARHYNAWYGMGQVYAKTGKIRHADHHYRRAAEINPTNAVLLSSIGSVLEQTDDIVLALKFYELACKNAPDSPMIQFKRIRCLVAMQRIEIDDQDAIASLEPLSRQAPDEANIFFLLGKCYLRQERRGDATVAFTTARELQPKLDNAIKAAIESNGEEEDEDEDE